ncbi:flagellar assembly regulator FliX [Brevundimonas diminuta]|uniref:Flagellar assembly regulator FliX n=1 Tax=Brevundimonas diminuta TaxID=293 RepID=A0A410NZR2_BREDI|nr:flagellar assembly protein FliX [Brevundimonas diminuta]MBD3573319.1 flagellar assembly regulator FliX [Brevundimonas diminuta]QAT15285.1 flagellar assembly regulator FliX [Brevundimonas diminuta]QQB87331.1 flagellar assembly regulator FliX [Brevundimonas diminuta]GEB99995.1 flagellar assembly protein FliX [Brevundimonas diminuta]
MKVTGPLGAASTPAARPAARGAGGFALPTTGGAVSAAQAGATSSASGVASAAALMALQGVEDPMERRRRAIRRGSGLLDRLDELKLALLGGQDGAAALGRLARDLREERDAEAEPGLKAVLDQIDLRASVELAKAEMSRSRS